jgi:peptidoglycan/xylan/chitin deacetylase (PgdA/CDA1 family)
VKHVKEMKEASASEYRAPKDFRWPNGARVGICFQIALEAWSDGKWPGVGPMANPLKAGVPDINALSWADYGPRCGVYNLLRILDRHRVTASAVVNGVIAERYPEALRAVTAAGHEIVGHSWGMDVMSIYLSEEEERANIARNSNILKEVGGSRPTGWISPRGTGGLYTNRLLAEAGYVWHGDRLNDDLPTFIDYGDYHIVGITSSTEVNDAPLHVRHGNLPRVLIDAFQDALEAYLNHDDPAVFNVTVHCHVFGRPPGAWAFQKVIELAKDNKNVWIGTKLEAVQHFKSVLGRI